VAQDRLFTSIRWVASDTRGPAAFDRTMAPVFVGRCDRTASPKFVCCQPSPPVRALRTSVPSALNRVRETGLGSLNASTPSGIAPPTPVGENPRGTRASRGGVVLRGSKGAQSAHRQFATAQRLVPSKAAGHQFVINLIMV